jgi:hypothetical protein
LDASKLPEIATFTSVLSSVLPRAGQVDTADFVRAGEYWKAQPRQADSTRLTVARISALLALAQTSRPRCPQDLCNPVVSQVSDVGVYVRIWQGRSTVLKFQRRYW